MLVLGIETSCDETAAAVVEDGRRILSSIVASQVRLHRDYGGVVPELASREHVDNICPVVQEALERAGCSWEQIDAVAATRGPGLIGALLVGLAYAKALAYSLQVPFLGINHLEGHVQSIFLDHPEAELPALALVVSGGHTSLFYMPAAGSFEGIARTRDDAAGEALDKLAKLAGLGYPGGPVIDRLAPLGDPESLSFALPKISDESLDFSFSGLKTAALRYYRQQGFGRLQPEQADHPETIPQPLLDLLASYQKSIVDQLINRLDGALSGREVRSVQVSGGVSCNSELRRRLREHFESRGFAVYFPRPGLTTDNAAMIAAAAAPRLRAGQSDPWNLPADPNLALW